ncbi:MAG: carbon-nitrogen hydrolase family protein [Nitrosopumilus sp.]|nr:carbon-nitrogen hydrolase family protein [Nitrosopumilus sp.]
MVKVGIIQTSAYRTNKEGITKISKFLEGLGKMKTEIVCLPEQWLKNNEIYDFDSEFLEFKEISKKYQMTIIPGAFYEKIKRDISITSPIIGPKGDIIGKQEKIHPFDYEKNTVTPGREVRVFNTACKFGVVICYDLVFPKVSETFVKKGAGILFSPSRIVRRGINPWTTYLQARSLENRVPILAANVSSRKYGGSSMIIDLFENNKVMIPKIIKIKKEGYAVKNFNLAKFEKNRKIRFSDSKKFV